MKKYIVSTRFPGEDWKEVKSFREEIPARGLADSIEKEGKKESKVEYKSEARKTDYTNSQNPYAKANNEA